MADTKKEKAKVRKPTALKRDQQSVKRNQRNRSFKSSVTTALRSLEEFFTKKDNAGVKEQLSALYSLMDKGVKKGIYKQNKAGRVKSRLTARAKSLVG